MMAYALHAILCIGISIRAALLSVGNSFVNMGLDYYDFYRVRKIHNDICSGRLWVTNAIVIELQEVKIKYSISA